jgi:hypothetical protein
LQFRFANIQFYENIDMHLEDRRTYCETTSPVY